MAELESSPTTSDGEASRSEKSSCFQAAKRDLSGNRFRTPFRSRTGVFPVGEPMHRFLLIPCCRVSGSAAPWCISALTSRLSRKNQVVQSGIRYGHLLCWNFSVGTLRKPYDGVIRWVWLAVAIIGWREGGATLFSTFTFTNYFYLLLCKCNNTTEIGNRKYPVLLMCLRINNQA